MTAKEEPYRFLALLDNMAKVGAVSFRGLKKTDLKTYPQHLRITSKKSPSIWTPELVLPVQPNCYILFLESWLGSAL